MVVADEVQHRVHQRPAPVVAGHLRADDDVAELARQSFRQVVERVHRERERVRRLVDPEMLELQRSALLRSDEDEAELARLDPLRREHAARELAGALLVDRDARAVVHLDLDHRLRAVPVCSEWRLYASTIRWTSLWRTTSRWLKCTNAIPSIEPRM